MKFLLFLLCFVCTVCYSFAAVAIEQASKDEDHPGHCYTKSHNLGAFEKGEQKALPDQCGTAICTYNGDIQYLTCGVIAVVPPCKLSKEDLSKPYPDCCPKPVCI